MGGQHRDGTRLALDQLVRRQRSARRFEIAAVLTAACLLMLGLYNPGGVPEIERYATYYAAVIPLLLVAGVRIYVSLRVEPVILRLREQLGRRR